MPHDGSLLLHLSDLHLCQTTDPPPPVMQRNLLAAIDHAVSETKGMKHAVVVTGDLIDSATTETATACNALGGLVHAILEIASCPVVLLPGNHDRRSSGLRGPWTHGLVQALRAHFASNAHVSVIASDRTDILATRVDALSDVLDAEVVAYDTTHTLRGMFSAGGLFRSEDLLSTPGIVSSQKPVVVLLHHHLIPTPVTDASIVESAKATWVERKFVEEVLPRVVSFGDREELFMTALRAGTALTLLHSLGSPSIVLHGHKHYPTARVLHAPTRGDGDVLLVSAGSAGLREPYRGAGPDDGAFIWPSFNTLRFHDDAVDAQTVFFAPNRKKPTVSQTLVNARRDKCGWTIDPVAQPEAASLDIASDVSVFALMAGVDGFWNFTCEREVTPVSGTFKPYTEPIEVVPVAKITTADSKALVRKNGRQFVAVHAGRNVRYRADDALCKTMRSAIAQYPGDDFSPFEWVWLDVRRGARIARLEVSGLPNARLAFATVTDLHTAQERRRDDIVVAGDRVTLTIHDCPARRLLKIYWPI